MLDDKKINLDEKKESQQDIDFDPNYVCSAEFPDGCAEVNTEDKK